MASILLITSYIFDWVVLIVFAVVGFIIGNLTPNKRPFSLDDPDISFPYKGYDTVSLGVLMIVSIVVPAAIIFFVALLFVPGPSTAPNSLSRSQTWRRKLWEWHAGWLGLAMSLILTWFFVSGMKNLFGKPRPNLLNRCEPNYASVQQFVVGNPNDTTTLGRLVSAAICQNTDKGTMDEGFRSFPSGHSAISAAGLVYLSLFLIAKLRAVPPWLPASINFKVASLPARRSTVQSPADAGGANPVNRQQYQKLSSSENADHAIREQGAGAPVYLLVISLIPFATAVFISSSRWFDYQHHGFDILFGFFIGTVSSFVAFRHYNLPLSRGAGWSWGPRGPDKAFWIGVGSDGYSASTPSAGRLGTEALPQGWEPRESYELQTV